MTEEDMFKLENCTLTFNESLDVKADVISQFKEESSAEEPISRAKPAKKMKKEEMFDEVMRC